MKTVSAILVPADIKQPMRVVELEVKHFNESEWSCLAAMYPLIGNGCSCVERVVLAEDDEAAGDDPHFIIGWVDEEGLCKADPQKNERASVLYGYPLYGNMIVCGDTGYNTVSLSKAMLESVPELDKMATKTVEAQWGVFVLQPGDRIIG
jgi:hypothetical protein